MQGTRTGPRRRSSPSGPADELARDLRDRRLALHLTQQAVADLADVGRSTVLGLESGRGGTSLGAALAVADVLGMKLALVPRTPGAGNVV